MICLASSGSQRVVRTPSAPTSTPTGEHSRYPRRVVASEAVRPSLDVRVAGGLEDANRFSANDLATLATVMQTAVRGVATVLSGGRAGVGGRKSRAIDAATELEVVAPPEKGSFVLHMELAVDDAELPGLKTSELGDRALRALTRGLDELAEAEERLPEGFDRGVLSTLDRLGPVLRKRQNVTLVANGAAGPRVAAMSTSTLELVERLMAQPLRAPVEIEGVLKMVDLAATPLLVRVDRGPLPSVSCMIGIERKAEVLGAIDKRVRLTGDGQFDPGVDQPRRVEVQELEVISVVAGLDPERIQRHLGWQDLAREQEVGPMQDPAQLAGLFADDDELDEFLASRPVSASRA